MEQARNRILPDVFPQLVSEMENIQRAMDSGKAHKASKISNRLKDTTRISDQTIFPLVNNGVEGVVIRIDDVTEKVRMEEMVIQSEKMLSVGGLAAGMAHEINNPLAGMMQNASVLAERLTNLEIPANQRAAEGTSLEGIRDFMEARGIIRILERIHESGHRAAEIVTNMLNFAHKGDATFSECNMCDLFDQIVVLAGSDYDLKKNFDFRQIEIVREYEENLPLVTCESGKIQQVLLNILRNGAEAMQEAGEKTASFCGCPTSRQREWSVSRSKTTVLVWTKPPVGASSNPSSPPSPPTAAPVWV